MRCNRLLAATLRSLPGLMCFCLIAAPQSQSGYAEAASQIRAGRPDTAIPILERIVNANPADLKARNLLGIALLNAGRKTEASAAFRKALQTDSKFQPALKNLAVNEMALG